MLLFLRVLFHQIQRRLEFRSGVFPKLHTLVVQLRELFAQRHFVYLKIDALEAELPGDVSAVQFHVDRNQLHSADATPIDGRTEIGEFFERCTFAPKT